MQIMADGFLPQPKMQECVADWIALGVKAVEVTGGGEPLLYPFIGDFFRLIRDSPIEWALVTNGTLLTEKQAKLAAGFSWARVSLDAGTSDTYANVHRTSRRHWELAWTAVDRLLRHKTHPEGRVGISYVVDCSNWAELYLCAQRAKKAGADNIRFSLAFTPYELDRLPDHVLNQAVTQAEAVARELADESFQVINQLGDRRMDLASPRQDYAFCAMKELVCVVAGDLNVYMCCTRAFTKEGLIGSIKDVSFRALWQSTARVEQFEMHDPRTACRMPCLYGQRNRFIAQLVDEDGDTLFERHRRCSHQIHKNFL